MSVFAFSYFVCMCTHTLYTVCMCIHSLSRFLYVLCASLPPLFRCLALDRSQLALASQRNQSKCQQKAGWVAIVETPSRDSTLQLTRSFDGSSQKHIETPRLNHDGCSSESDEDKVLRALRNRTFEKKLQRREDMRCVMKFYRRTAVVLQHVSAQRHLRLPDGCRWQLPFDIFCIMSSAFF